MRLTTTLRICVSSDGTVTDGTTGLTWEKKTANLDPSDPHDVGARHTWSAPGSIGVDGSIFSDHQVRAALIKKGFDNVELEWMRCSVSDVKTVLTELRTEFTRLSEGAATDPFRNPVLMLAHHVSRRLARGEVSLPVLESALQTLSVQGFLARSRQIGRAHV